LVAALHTEVVGFCKRWLTHSDAGERGKPGALPPRPFKRGTTRAEVHFHNSIIGNFMVLKQMYCSY